MKKHLFLEGKMSEGPDRRPAVEIFLKTKDLLLDVFVKRHVEDVGTLFSLARLTRRTKELLYNHPDLVLARNVHKQFVPKEHVNHRPYSRLFQGRTLDSDHPECCPCLLVNGSNVYCSCICHRPCEQCIVKVFVREDLEKVDPKMTNNRQCQMFQRQWNALYVQGNIRLFVYYKGLAGSFLSPAFDFHIAKLLERGHHAMTNWIVDKLRTKDRSFDYFARTSQESMHTLSLGVPTFQASILARSLTIHRNEERFPKKEFLPTLDAALRYLDWLKVPATLEIAKRTMIPFILKAADMNLEGRQAFFNRFPGLKTLYSQEGDDDKGEPVQKRSRQ